MVVKKLERLRLDSPLNPRLLLEHNLWGRAERTVVEEHHLWVEEPAICMGAGWRVSVHELENISKLSHRDQHEKD